MRTRGLYGAVVIASILLLTSSVSAIDSTDIRDFYGKGVVSDNYLATSYIVDKLNANIADSVSLKEYLNEEDYSSIKDTYDSTLLHLDTNIHLISKDMEYAEKEITGAYNKGLKDILKAESAYKSFIISRKVLNEERKTLYTVVSNSNKVKPILSKLDKSINSEKDVKDIDIGKLKVTEATNVKLDITRPYGVVINKDTNELDFHKGIDVRAPRGSYVKTLYSGKVIIANESYTLIQHGSSIHSLYMNYKDVQVKEGDFVEQGQKLAKSKEEDIHIGLYVNGNPVDLTSSIK